MTTSAPVKPIYLAAEHAALEAAADDLLLAAGCLGRRCGAYTQAQLERKMRRDHRNAERGLEQGLCQDVVEYLAERQLDELVDVSGLTAMQEICLRLRISGLSCRRIAATLKAKHQVIAVHLATAEARVRAAYKEGRYAGWYQVYLSEVNRPVYRPRSRPGKAE